MGNAFSICSCNKHRIGCVKDITLLMIGLDNAGKTCTAKHLLGESTADAVPTVGFSSISLKHGKYNVTIYDLGGGPKIRAIWKKYYALVHGLIFVVDASDPQRLDECKAEIGNVLKDDKIAGKPMLVLVNKQDVSGALDETELVSRLDLEVLVNEQKCPTRVESSCAVYDVETKIKDPGIQEGFNWLIGLIIRDFDVLHQRVEQEVNEQKQQEEKERAERMERVQKIREERERLTRNLSKEGIVDCDDDDDDVVIGNPFKPCNIIKAEFEQREKEKAEKAFDVRTEAVKVIHVSPIHGVESSNQNEVILHPQPLIQKTIFSNDTKESVNIPELDALNGNPFSSAAVCEEETKKKTKKSKKRFKNRIVPEIQDSNISLIPRINELPPLRPNIENARNGQPNIYISPKQMQQNGNINWALAEELEPCREVSSAGCSNKRTEAWSDLVH